MSRQSHKPCPPPFFLSLQKQLSMRLPPLATQAPTSHIFVLLSFERPPAPVANASTSLPLLAAQADQALQPFSPNITNYVACSRSKREAASACNMSEIEVFRDESPTDSSDPPAAFQSTSDPQDNSTEPVAAIQGRRPSRTTAANASKRRSPPSPSPPRQQPPSPASSYASVFSHAPSAENWTVAELRQVLTSAGVIIPRRSSKSDLLALYNSLQSGELLNSSPPLKSATTASKSRKSPYSRPGPIFTPSRTGLRPPNRSSRPSASLGRAPGYRSPQPPPSSSFHRAPARNSAQRRVSLRLHKPPHQNKHASVSGIQLHAASDQRTPPLPMARSSATHGQPYSISASPGARLPPPSLRPPSSFRLKLTPIIDPNTSHSPPSSTQSAPSPEPPFLFLPPRLYPYLQTH